MQVPAWLALTALLVTPLAFASGVASGACITFRLLKGHSPLPTLPTLGGILRPKKADAASPNGRPTLAQRGVPARIKP